jgi:hypothetical protein
MSYCKACSPTRGITVPCRLVRKLVPHMKQLQLMLTYHTETADGGHAVRQAPWSVHQEHIWHQVTPACKVQSRNARACGHPKRSCAHMVG